VSAGSGKSTFAAQHFIPTNIVSSDYCRAMICDDVNNQQVNRDTFDLFYYIIQKRMFLDALPWRIARASVRSQAQTARVINDDLATWAAFSSSISTGNLPGT